MSLNWHGALKKYPEANFLQSPEWGKVNTLDGHTVLTRSLGSHSFAQMIVKNARRARYLEVPGGPLTDWADRQKAAAVVAQVRDVARKYRCAFVRVRPQIPDTPGNRQLFTELGFRPAPMHLAAEHTVMIDLRLSEEKLLANLRRQTRYEVRRAEKQGITVKKLNSETIFREFHACQAETARRQNFVPPSLATLLHEWEAFGEKAWIYRAELGGAPVAYGLILTAGREADYFEAASTELNRTHPGSTALLWHAIRELKKLGFERFNLWGIAPEGQPNHRYAKVTTFKRGFGGEVVAFLPAQDLVVSKVRYLPDLLIEKARKKRRHL